MSFRLCRQAALASLGEQNEALPFRDAFGKAEITEHHLNPFGEDDARVRLHMRAETGAFKFKKIPSPAPLLACRAADIGAMQARAAEPLTCTAQAPHSRLPAAVFGAGAAGLVAENQSSEHVGIAVIAVLDPVHGRYQHDLVLPWRSLRTSG